MNKYVFEDLIMNPETPGLEDFIGKEVYFNNIPHRCLEWANTNCNTGILKEIRKDCLCPFRVDNREGDIIGFACIILKKEEPKPKYVPFENQKEFVRAYQKFKESIKYDTFENNLADYGIWVKNKNGISCSMVIEIWDEGVALGGETQSIYWQDLYKYYTFPDGSPCGKEVRRRSDV